MAHQQDVVVVDVDIGKGLAHHRRQDLSRLEEVVDTARLRTLHDGTLSLRILAPELFGHHLVDGERQCQLVGVLAGLHLFAQPGIALEDTLLECLGLQVVEAEAYLLVTLVTVIVVALQVGLLLIGYHLAHQFYGRVVLTAIARFLLRLDGHLAECAVLGREADGELGRGLGIDVDHLFAIAYGTDGESPAIVAFNAETAIAVGDCRYAVAFILYGGVGHRTSVLGIYHHTGDLSQHPEGHRQQDRQYQRSEARRRGSFLFHGCKGTIFLDKARSFVCNSEKMPTFAAEKIVKLIKIPKYETIISVDITFRLPVMR